MTMQKKAAFAAVVGRPSAGKSTLINQLCGEHIAIVSPVPQTTRNTIRGIVHHARGQLVLVDTPGIHLSEKKFNQRLSDTAFRSISESDIILYVLDAARAPGPEEEAIADKIGGHCYGKAGQDGASFGVPGGAVVSNLVVAVNKIDLPSANINRSVEFIQNKFPALEKSRIIPISAQEKQGMDTLLDALFALAPEGEAFYPEEYYTDQEIDFRIAEIIREAALPYLHQELPHAVYVEVADRELRPAETRTGAAKETQRLWVRAFLICERESQKGMIVGKGGKIIKAIKEASQKKLNSIFDWKADLDLRVKTGKDWRHNDVILRKLLG